MSKCHNVPSGYPPLSYTLHTVDWPVAIGLGYIKLPNRLITS